MGSVQKKIDILGRLKWLSIFLGVVMFAATEQLVGVWIATVLSMIANLAFFFICENGANAIICEHVAEDIKAAVSAIGNQKCMVETRKFSIGLVARVYLIGAGAKAPVYSGIVMDHIRSSWYKKKVWITQFIDMDNESEFDEAKEMLDDELYSDIEKLREEYKAKRK